jgi:imidazolonepropionase-like amidohydrolase
MSGIGDKALTTGRAILFLAMLCMLPLAMADEPPLLQPGVALRGAWFDPETPGQGLLLDIETETGFTFGAWFTFDLDAPSGIQGQRWFTLQGSSQLPTADLDIIVSRGGVFDRGDPVEHEVVGVSTLRFFNCNQGRLDYQWVDGPEGSIDLQRLLAVPESQCDSLVEVQAVPFDIDWSQSIALVGATVLPMTGADALDNQTIIVADGVIQELGPASAVAIPETARVIDARTRYLIPGITDAHTHLATNAREFAGFSVPLFTINTIAKNQLMLYLANGVTTIINNGDFDEPVPLYADQVRSGELIGPTIYAAKFARGNVDGCSDGNPLSVTVGNPATARQYLRNAQAQGYDFIKLYNCTPRDSVFALLDEGRIIGMPGIGHTPQTVSVPEVLDGGMRMVAHAESYVWTLFGFQHQTSGIPNAVEITRRNDAWVTGTLFIEELIAQIYGGNTPGIEAYWSRPENIYMHGTTVNLNNRSIDAPWRWNPAGSQPGQWDPRRDFVYQLALAFHQGDVRLLLGTDSPTVLGVPGFSALEELRVLVEIGIPVDQALEIATANGGEFINEQLPESEPFGRIAAGQRADLILLDTDPRVQLPNRDLILGVMARGWWYSAAFFDQQLTIIAESYGNMSP